MIFVSWKDSYVTGIEEIDAQHQKLIKLLQHLHTVAATKKMTSEEISAAIVALVDYAAEHFATEERYFEKCGYPDRNSHVMEHQLFVTKIKKFQKDFEAGKVCLGDEILSFLRSWIDYHIMVVDKKYIPHLKTCLAKKD